MAVKPNKKELCNLSYEDTVKIIKSMKGSQCIVGKEIDTLCLVERYLTGIPTLDFLGAVTKGRVNIFVGPKSSGKSTCVYMLLAKHTQEIKARGDNKFVLVWATEGYDAAYAAALGVDSTYVIVKRTKIIEDGLAECEDLINMGIIEAMAWDSMAMSVARKSDESEYGACRGSNSGAFSEHLPKFYNALLEHGVTSYWIQQARLKQSGFNPTGGEVLVMPGGKIIENIPDNIYFFKRMSNYNLTYTPTQVKCEKARSSKIGMVLELPLGKLGFDKCRDIVNLAILAGYITTKGAGWSSFTINGEEYKVQGQEKIIAMLENDPVLFKQFWDDVYQNCIFNNEGIVFANGLTMDTELLTAEDNV